MGQAFRCATFLLLTAALLSAGSARADEKPETPPPDSPESPESPESPAEPAAKRPLPDYDGRGGPRQTPGQRALIIPRVVLFPAYLLSEYVVRRPLGAAITYVERAGWPAAVIDFLALGESHPLGVLPFALVDFGFQPSVGLYAYWDDAGFQGHQLRLRGSTWGKSWLSATATERFLLGELELAWTATATRRPDYAFYGIGPDVRESSKVRYSGDTVYGRFESRFTFAGRNVLEATAGYRGAA